MLCLSSLIPGTMLLLLLMLLQSSQANPTTESSSPATSIPSTDDFNLCPCTENTTTPSAPYKAPSNAMIHGMTCVCRAGPAHISRDDYKYTPGIGAHKLHTRAATWNEARKMCNEEGAHLAIVNSLSEAHVMMDIFAKAGPVKGASYIGLAYVGIHDLYKEGEWVTILGESLFKSGYTIWSDKWGGQPDNGGGAQNCGVFLKEGGLDDVNCEVPFAFFCELPTTHIVH